MTPVFCGVSHDPNNGSDGDCLRACIATVLNLPAEAVPHVMRSSGNVAEMWQELRDHLKLSGLAPVVMNFAGQIPLNELLTVFEAQNPGAVVIVIGTGHYGSTHAVVAQGGEIVHDPSLSSEGLVSPVETADGLFWQMVVIARL